jgi:hypothetical protein
VNKKRKGIVFLPVLVAFLILGIIGFVVYQNYQTKLNDQVIPPEHYPIETKPTQISPPTTLTTTPKPTLDEEKEISWEGYSCVIRKQFLSEMENGSVAAENPNIGCGVPVTYCKNQICTAPVEKIECGQSKTICEIEIYCSCPSEILNE